MKRFGDAEIKGTAVSWEAVEKDKFHDGYTSLHWSQTMNCALHNVHNVQGRLTMRWSPGSFQGKAPLSPHLQQQLQWKEENPTSSFQSDSKYFPDPKSYISLFFFLGTFDLMNWLVSLVPVEFSLPGLFSQVWILILFLPITTSKALRFNSSNPQKLSQTSSWHSHSLRNGCFLQTRQNKC